jgi:hypothetical protein
MESSRRRKEAAKRYRSYVTPDEQRLLEIETAKMRHAWATAEVKRGGSTPALETYLAESLQELRPLGTVNAKKKAARR